MNQIKTSQRCPSQQTPTFPLLYSRPKSYNSILNIYQELQQPRRNTIPA